jgi:Skp family chaperone for outer membrane proteins
MKLQTFIIAILILLAGNSILCVPRSREERRTVQIRYVYIPALLEYLAKGDPKAKELETRKNALRASIDAIKSKLGHGGGEIPEAVLRGDLKKYENELKTLSIQEEKLKYDYYRTIDSAVATVARRLEIDCVFNRGEELLYAKKEYDITEKVIHELSSRKNRTAPHSR